MALPQRTISGMQTPLQKLQLKEEDERRRAKEFAIQASLVSAEKEKELNRRLKDVAETGMSELFNLQRGTERASRTLEMSLARLSDLMDRAKNQASSLTRALFESDRSLARALKVAQRKASQQEEGGSFQVTYQGQTFTLDQLDPSKIIKQRGLTRQEQAALNKIDDNTAAIIQQLNFLVSSLTGELRLLNDFEKTAKNLITKLGLYVGRLDIHSETYVKSRVEIIELQRAIANASGVESQLRKIRKQAIQALKLSQRTKKIISQTSDRRSLESTLMMVGGGGLLIAVLAGLTLGGIAAGVVALPALVAAAGSKLLHMVRVFRGG